MDVSKLLEKAKECAEKRNYDMSIELYLQALRLSPDDGQACRDLRAVEIRQSKEKPASFMTKTRNAGTMAKANGLMAMKKYDSAIESAEEVLKSEPGSMGARTSCSPNAAKH